MQNIQKISKTFWDFFKRVLNVFLGIVLYIHIGDQDIVYIPWDFCAPFVMSNSIG